MANSWQNRLMVTFFKLPWVRHLWSKRFKSVATNGIPWTPLRKPLAECRIALVTTGGVHLNDAPPFNMADKRGDPTYRPIPSTVQPDDVTITHIYYDHSDADEDLNLILPVDMVRQADKEGLVGSIAETFYSFMGHIEPPHVDTLINCTAPEVVRSLKQDKVDIVLLVPA